jgi:hypothetical protein
MLLVQNQLCGYQFRLDCTDPADSVTRRVKHDRIDTTFLIALGLFETRKTGPWCRFV